MCARGAVFTNRIEDLRLQDLAEVDLREAVFQVQEFFGDFTVLDPHHFAVPIPQNHVTLQPFTWDYGKRCAPWHWPGHRHARCSRALVIIFIMKICIFLFFKLL